MGKDPQLKLLTNIPVIFTLGKHIKTGTGQYGEWHMWSLTIDGIKHTFFPTDSVHQQLQSFAEGTEIKIEKKEGDAGRNFIELNPTDPKNEPVTPQIAEKTFNQTTQLKQADNQTAARREFSIIVQSIMHNPGWYKVSKTYEENLTEAIKDARLLIKTINEIEL